jgi:hypothetical protein
VNDGGQPVDTVTRLYYQASQQKMQRDHLIAEQQASSGGTFQVCKLQSDSYSFYSCCFAYLLASNKQNFCEISPKI